MSLDSSQKSERIRLLSVIRSDWERNPGNSRIRIALLLLRVSTWSQRADRFTRILLLPVRVLYQLLVVWVFGIDIAIGTSLGPGLRIMHGYGLVIHRAAHIGKDCTLRQNVTIGIRNTGDVLAPTLRDGVDVGSGAQILGGITLGENSKVGAGAIVLADIPAGGVAVGNPARLLPR